MMWKRLLAAVVVVCLLGFAGPAILAQETPEPSGETETQGKPAEEPVAEAIEPEPKKKFKFALYVEAAFGSGDSDDIDTSIATRSTDLSANTLSLKDNPFGRAVVGWKLPEDRGSFLLRFEGYKEDTYEFVAVGSQARVADSAALATEPLRWWSVRAGDGVQESSLARPFWDGNDINGNEKPDPDEIRYEEVPGLASTMSAPKNLQNRVQTIELLYQRDFGGRKTSGRWAAGIRHFVYEGNIPAGAWLGSAGLTAGLGYTNGPFMPLLSFNQESTAIGPTGSLEVQQHLFRDRLVFYAQGRASFLLQSAEADSGEFFTLVRNPLLSSLVPAPARLTKELDKSIWHSGAEAGARIKLANGLHLHLAYSISAYLDALLLPTGVIAPDLLQQVTAGEGASGIFKTKDLIMTGWYGGLSFQY